MKLGKMTLVAGVACIGLLVLTASVQAAMFDDFEDGDFTSNPAWAIIYGTGGFSVATDTGGSGTSAMKCGPDGTGGIASTDAPDMSGAFEIRFDYHGIGINLCRPALHFGSLDGRNYVEMEWSPSDDGISKMALMTKAADHYQRTDPHVWFQGDPGDDVLHSFILGRQADGTAYLIMDDGSIVSMTCLNSVAFDGPLEQIIVRNQKLGGSTFFDNITLVPEPGALVLLAGGLLVLLCYVWRRNK